MAKPKARKLTKKQMAKVRANLAKTYERQRLPKKNPVLTLFFDGPILLGTDKVIPDAPKKRREKMKILRNKMKELTASAIEEYEKEVQKNLVEGKFKIKPSDKTKLRESLETFRIKTAVGFRNNAFANGRTIKQVLVDNNIW